jgi:hypothetical protein
VQERLDNCIRIAAEKTDPDDRAGWLEDASYFRAILSVLDSRPSSAAERERCAKIADGYALRAADSAQVVLANAAEEARAAISYETKKAIAAHLKEKQNFLHGKRHCAVEIAKDIRDSTASAT